MQRLRSECIRCILDKHLTAFPEDAQEEQKVIYMQNLLHIVANAPLNSSAPVLMEEVEDLQKQMFGRENRFEEVKKHFNQVMLGYEADVRAQIQAADDPLLRAVQFALAGNYIDFGAMQHVDENKLQKLLERRIPVDERQYRRFKRDVLGAGKLLYITDNCGEIVMDKLLIQAVKNLNPELLVQVMVRGGTVLNDATRTDAVQTGLDQAAEVLDNGMRVAGTCIEKLRGEALKAVEGADVIIAKGQGNFETMRMCGKNAYYLFLCKCQMFADAFGVPRLTGVLISDDSL